jgi:hypothetical protein
MTDEMGSVLSLLVPAIGGITDATPIKADVIYKEKFDVSPPSDGSLISRAALVFWRNTDDDIAMLIIPSLADSIETTDDMSLGVVSDLSVFDELTSTLSTLEAYDAQGIAVNGVVIAAALFI